MLCAHTAAWAPVCLSSAKVSDLRAIDLVKLPAVQPQRYVAPVAGIRQCMAIGLNYRKHAAEAGMELPKDPIVFFKAINRDQDVPRSGFKPMPSNTSVKDAVDLLNASPANP